jgi:glycosyltransferase involved in cell wall biosynthesis
MLPERSDDAEHVVIVAARNEADRIVSTVEGLKAAFPGARLILADDRSGDGTPRLAAGLGVEIAPGPSNDRSRGKGGAMTEAAMFALAGGTNLLTVVLCDGDLGKSAGALGHLAEAVDSGECDLAIATFARREGGGFGIALGFARRAIRRLTGLELSAPISGQRALRAELLSKVLPFAPGFGMEIGMTVDAVRAGARIKEIELDLEHRSTGRTLSGFVHRARQLLDFARVYCSRRSPRRVSRP